MKVLYIVHRVIFTRTLPRAVLCVTVLVRKSAPIAVAESRLKPQFSSKNEPRCHCRIYQIDKRWKHSTGKSCKVTGKHCIGDGRKEPEVGPRQEDNEDEDKLFPRGTRNWRGEEGTFFEGGN